MTPLPSAPLKRESALPPGRARRILRAGWLLFAWLLVGAFFVSGTLLLIVRYGVMPRVDELRPRIEQMASRALKARVTIGRIEASWHGLNPHLVLSGVGVTGPSDTGGLSLPRVEGTVSWLSAVALEPRFTLLRIDAPDLEVVRLPNDQFSVAGFLLQPGAQSEEPGLADWALTQGEIVVLNARIRYIDRRSSPASASFELTNANLQLENVLGSHVVGLQAQPPSTIAGPIDVRARFRHAPFSQPSDHTRWAGEIYGSVDYADIAALARLFGSPFKIERAEGAVRSWLNFDRNRITRVLADVALTNVNVTLADDLKPLTLASLQGRLSQRRWGDDAGTGNGGQEFAATGLTMVNGAQESTAPVDIEVRTTRARGGIDERTEVRASRVDLHNLGWLAAHVPLAAALREPISKHALTGTLTQLAAGWSGATPNAKTLTLKTQFQQLGSVAGATPPHELALPGFENLSGSIDVVEGAGTLQLSSKDAVVVLPGVFAEPRVKLSRLDSKLRWKADPTFELRVDSFAASNADIDVSASGTYRLPAPHGNGEKRADGWVDVTGRIARLNVQSAYKYVPMSAGNTTIEWLQHALVAGRLSDGALRIRGDLAHFPFRQEGQGEMRFTARIAEAALDVHPVQEGGRAWPLLTGIDAELTIDRASMTVAATRASAYGVRLANVVARIAELGDESTLDVRGSADGALSEMLRYVNSSPVARWIGGVTTNSGAAGNSKLDLRLTIPLHQASNTKVAGALQFLNNDLLLTDVPPFTRVSGTLNFTEAGVNTSGLNALMLGGPVKIDATTRPDGAMVFAAAGVASVPGIRRAMTIGKANALLDRSQGQARYTASLTVKTSPELVIDTDLVGIAIDGIAPLRKTAAEAMPLRIERTVALADRDEIRVTAGRVFAVRLERRLERTEYRVTRGVIAVNEAANLPESGLLVLATMPRLDLQAWSTFLGSSIDTDAPAAKSTSAAGPEMAIDLLAIRTQELILMGRTFRNVTLGATRTADNGFDANVVSDNLAGYVSWRPEQITARLSRLSIPAAIKGEVVAALHSSPRALPALDVSAEQFELVDLKLGRLDLLAQNVGAAAAPAWHVKRFDVTNSDMKLTASAEWAPAAGAAARRIKMRFKLDASNAGATLDRLGFAGAMASGSGALNGDVEWLGSPFDINYPSLTGTLALSVDDGRFLKVETGNAARLLGLLSLQSLSRTLADGGGQFADGFAYSSIRADATVKEGVITTDNFRMAGASAAALMSGTIDLRNETQQLHLVVLPKIEASTAALALGVANPVLGLGALLATYMLRDPLSKAFALEYDIGGSWAHPSVSRRGRVSAQAPSVNETER